MRFCSAPAGGERIETLTQMLLLLCGWERGPVRPCPVPSPKPSERRRRASGAGKCCIAVVPCVLGFATLSYTLRYNRASPNTASQKKTKGFGWMAGCGDKQGGRLASSSVEARLLRCASLINVTANPGLSSPDATVVHHLALDVPSPGPPPSSSRSLNTDEGAV